MTENRISEREYIEAYLHIVDKDSHNVPFRYNSVQQYIERSLAEGHAKGYRKFLIVKSRKQGASSLILAKFLIRCLTLENRRAVVVSHESGATQRLLGRVYSYKDGLDPQPPVETESSKELSFTETKSSYYIGTAGSKAFGRGDDITDLHVSELDWWENTDVLTGLLEACVPSAEVMVESTVNGWGSKMHGLWLGAKKGENDWYPIFIPWYMSDEYSRPDLVTPDFVLDEAEEEYRAKYGLDMAQMAWRRMKLRSMDRPELFPQEYPADDIEAFLITGNAVFDNNVLSEWYNMGVPYEQGVLEMRDTGVVEWVKQSGGWLRVYAHPLPDIVYRIGADVAEGIENEAKDRDYSTAVCKHGQTWAQVAVMGYRMDPDIHARRLNLMGRYYNNAKLAVERNGPGIAVLSFLQRDHKYPNLYYQEILDERTKRATKKFGWDENEKTRGMLIALQKRAIREKMTLLVDKQTIAEHMSFVTNSHGKDEATSGAHDDYVFADMIATKQCELNPHYDPTTDWARDKQFLSRREQNKSYMDRYMAKKRRYY